MAVRGRYEEVWGCEKSWVRGTPKERERARKTAAGRDSECLFEVGVGVCESVKGVWGAWERRRGCKGVGEGE